MLPTTVTLPSEELDGNNADLVLTKRSEQNGITTYTGLYQGGTPAADRRVILEVKHTRPSDPNAKASSLMKTTLHTEDADGSTIRTSKSWTVTEGTPYATSWAKAAESITKSFSNHSGVRDDYFDGSY